MWGLGSCFCRTDFFLYVVKSLRWVEFFFGNSSRCEGMWNEVCEVFGGAFSVAWRREGFFVDVCWMRWFCVGFYV